MRQMKNNIIFLFFFFLFGPTTIFSQSTGITMDPNPGSGYITVRDYGGTTASRVNSIQIHFAHESMLEPGWHLEFILTDPIMNTSGKEFPAEKLKIRWNNHTLTGNQSISISDLGIITTPMSLSYFGYQNLILNSGLQKSNPGVFMLELSLDILVDGGAYLQEFDSWNEYSFNIEYRLQDHTGQIITSNTRRFLMQVKPVGTPPVDPDFSLQISPNAKNINLDFTSLQDYRNGKSVHLPGALQVSSSAPYEIVVRANTEELFSAQNERLPLDIIQITASAHPGIQSRKIQLKDQDQNIITGTQPAEPQKNFDIRYFTAPNDQRLLDAKPTNYSTILIYTLQPL